MTDYISRPDVTLESHPDHHTVGQEFMGGYPSGRWFCESHDQAGYWMYRCDGPVREWHNVSERAIGASFHKIYELDGRKICSWGRVKPYVEPAEAPA